MSKNVKKSCVSRRGGVVVKPFMSKVHVIDIIVLVHVKYAITVFQNVSSDNLKTT